jgi:hypothetical protein
MRGIAIGLVMCIMLAGCASIGVGGTNSHSNNPLQYDEMLHGSAGPPIARLVIHAAPGYEPNADILWDVADEISRGIQKPVDVEVRPLEHDGTPDSRYDVMDLVQLAIQVHEEPWPAGEILLQAIAIGGCYATEERPCIGGVAVRHTAFVFFDEKESDIPGALGGLPFTGHSSFQRYILMHELGHVIGLLNNPAPAINTARIADDGCNCHSTSTDSVMSGAGALITFDDEEPHGHLISDVTALSRGELHNWQFDGDDIADLRAYQASIG